MQYEVQNYFRKCFPYFILGKSFSLSFRKISLFEKYFPKHLSSTENEKILELFALYQTHPLILFFSNFSMKENVFKFFHVWMTYMIWKHIFQNQLI